MAKPKQRELDAVSKLQMLSKQEVATLYMILGVLGFDSGTIALFWEKTEVEVRTLFRIDAQKPYSLPGLCITGSDLAWWCERIHLRPGVVQQRLNFDESNLRLKKQGRSSTRVPAGWIGPPLFAIKGSCVEGRAFVELADLVKLSARLTLNTALLGQIAAGKYPLRLPWLRELMVVLAEAEISHPKVTIIEKALAQFPFGVRTPEEVLEELTTQVEKEESSELTQAQKEESVRVEIVDRFRAEVEQRGILPVLQKLHTESPDIRQLCQEWQINVPGEILPGHFEVIVWSVAFTNATKQWPKLTKPLQELSEWLVAERRREANRVVERNVRRPYQASAPSVPTPTPASVTVENRVFAPTERPARPVVPAAPPRPTSTNPEQVETDELDVTWNWTKRQIIIGVVSVPLDPLSDARLQGDIRTVSKRVYDSLCTLRGSIREDAVAFCQQIGIERLWFSGLVDSSSQLNPRILKRILDKLRTSYEVDLTPAQLFGLKPLPRMAVPAMQRKDSCVVDTVAPVELLFPLGDARAGYRWASLLLKYRTVLKWFRQNYGVTDEDIARIEEGKIGVPVPVHHVLMWKVRERIKGSEGIVIPRSYEWLLRNPHSRPVQDGSFVLDESQIPIKNWLRQ